MTRFLSSNIRVFGLDSQNIKFWTDFYTIKFRYQFLGLKCEIMGLMCAPITLMSISTSQDSE
jgi:hypothetical protein